MQRKVIKIFLVLCFCVIGGCEKKNTGVQNSVTITFKGGLNRAYDIATNFDDFIQKNT